MTTSGLMILGAGYANYPLADQEIAHSPYTKRDSRFSKGLFGRIV